MLTYTDLKLAIQQYSENYETSFVSRLDTFILQAENRIAHLVRLPPYRKQTTLQFQSGDRYITPPSDYLSCDSIFVIDFDERFEMLNKEPEFIDICYPVTSDWGRPRFYAKVDDKTLVIGPTSDALYDAELGYFACPPSITITVDGHSWLGDNAESLLLYACLVEAYTYMKGEMELLQWYDKQLKEAVNSFKGFGDGRARKDSLEEPDKRVAV